MASRTQYGLYDGMDDSTSAAILEVQINDIDELISDRMGSNAGNNDNPSELEITLRLHKEELQRDLTTIQDRRLSHSLAMRVMHESNANNNAISAAIAQESRAEADRAVALSLAGLPVPPAIQQALAGLGDPTPSQTPRQAAIPPRQLPPLRTGRPRPWTSSDTQRHGMLPSRPVAPESAQRFEPTAVSANRKRQWKAWDSSLPSYQSVPGTSSSFSSAPNQSTTMKPIGETQPVLGMRGQSLPTPSSKLPNLAPAAKIVPRYWTSAKRNSNTSGSESPSSIGQGVPTPSQPGSSRMSDHFADSFGKDAAIDEPISKTVLPTEYASARTKSSPPNATPSASCATASSATSQSTSSNGTAETTNGGSSYDDHSRCGSQSNPNTTGYCIPVKKQKRKFENDGEDHSHTKKVDIGEENIVKFNFRTKRRREEDGNLESTAEKRVDTGAGKVIDLTRHQETFKRGTKHRLEDDDPGPRATKRVDTGAKKVIDLTGGRKVLNSTTKRSRENDDDPGSRTEKRVDTGVSKVISEQASPRNKIRKCISCFDDFESVHTCQMPCKHDYCYFCVQRVVINALVDEACYPPRCCQQPFEIESMRVALTPELISGFYEKKTEFETVDRTYCSSPKCSAFLYPVNIIAEIGTCPMCFTVTCKICKGPAHQHDCPQDAATQQVLQLAAAEGWKRCAHCKRMIELKVGCNHIT
ncbi:uncharacterized protein RSE6_13184 [Rhynchosporium secalis]|uniref:RBR-type E3 ubiquitin transferase n=1 Tax=Rhynchosporium secalis TaxID=38038 RepID=A0A1E1MS89_RHYSE|nr:uncharacterized protein RSE6_13184 [Rhynchosporium secalis]